MFLINEIFALFQSAVWLLLLAPILLNGSFARCVGAGLCVCECDGERGGGKP